MSHPTSICSFYTKKASKQQAAFGNACSDGVQSSRSSSPPPPPRGQHFALLYYLHTERNIVLYGRHFDVTMKSASDFRPSTTRKGGREGHTRGPQKTAARNVPTSPNTVPVPPQGRARLGWARTSQVASPQDKTKRPTKPEKTNTPPPPPSFALRMCAAALHTHQDEHQKLFTIVCISSLRVPGKIQPNKQRSKERSNKRARSRNSNGGGGGGDMFTRNRAKERKSIRPPASSDRFSHSVSLCR